MRVPGHQRTSYTWRWTAALAGLAVLALATVMAVVASPAGDVQAATFTVDHLGDDSGQACTTTAGDCSLRSAIEQANANAVADTISFGTLSGTISIGSALPALSAAEATTVDGNGNITVDGAPGFDCFTVTSDGNVIRDLLITGCTNGVAITGDPADGNAVRGNTIFSNTADGVLIDGGADSNTVGGTTAADRNIIRDNGAAGVAMADAGTTGNVVSGNCIGTLPDCSTAAPNGIDGVAISAATSGNTVGGTAGGAGNTIAFNGDDGVEIGGGTGQIVTRNVMFLNTGVGIDSPVAAPLLTGCADAGGGNVSCTGTAAAPGNVVELYRANVDAAGPEGDLFLCSAIAGGGGAFGCTFGNPGGGSATATQRDPGGFNNTSSFAAPVGIPAGPVVTSTPTPTNTPSVTNTPSITPTATGTPPTATPSRTATPQGGVTSTPTTGPTESVTLTGGTCNPVASTYADNTPVATIAGAVTPSGILVSIWNFEAGVWRGYSPQFPSVSDLTDIDRLDAFFICVSSAGTFSRPQI